MFYLAKTKTKTRNHKSHHYTVLNIIRRTTSCNFKDWGICKFLPGKDDIWIQPLGNNVFIVSTKFLISIYFLNILSPNFISYHDMGMVVTISLILGCKVHITSLNE